MGRVPPPKFGTLLVVPRPMGVPDEYRAMAETLHPPSTQSAGPFRFSRDLPLPTGTSHTPLSFRLWVMSYWPMDFSRRRLYGSIAAAPGQ